MALFAVWSPPWTTWPAPMPPRACGRCSPCRSALWWMTREDAGTTISAANAARYSAFDVCRGGAAGSAVALYARLYPLFQQAHEELGYPNGTFNDRLVAVLDHLLLAPEPQGPLRVKLTPGTPMCPTCAHGCGMNQWTGAGIALQRAENSGAHGARQRGAGQGADSRAAQARGHQRAATPATLKVGVAAAQLAAAAAPWCASTSLSEKLVGISRTPGRLRTWCARSRQTIPGRPPPPPAGSRSGPRGCGTTAPGHGHHLAFQGRGGLSRVVVQRQLHKTQHAPAHALAVQVGVVARNHPGSSSARTRRQQGEVETTPPRPGSPTVARPSRCRALSRVRSTGSSGGAWWLAG